MAKKTTTASEPKLPAKTVKKKTVRKRVTRTAQPKKSEEVKQVDVVQVAEEADTLATEAKVKTTKAAPRRKKVKKKVAKVARRPSAASRTPSGEQEPEDQSTPKVARPKIEPAAIIEPVDTTVREREREQSVPTRPPANDERDESSEDDSIGNLKTPPPKRPRLQGRRPRRKKHRVEEPQSPPTSDDLPSDVEADRDVEVVEDDQRQTHQTTERRDRAPSDGTDRRTGRSRSRSRKRGPRRDSNDGQSARRDSRQEPNADQNRNNDQRESASDYDDDEVVAPENVRTMLINVSGGDECRIAVMHQGRLEEIFIERSSAQSHVGNIYKGRIMNVEPSIQAAFIDFGLQKNGFLHISDVQPQYFPNYNGEPEEVGRKIPRRERPAIQDCFRRGQEPRQPPSSSSPDWPATPPGYRAARCRYTAHARFARGARSPPGWPLAHTCRS